MDTKQPLIENVDEIQLPYDRDNDSPFWVLIELLENAKVSEKNDQCILANQNNTKLYYNTLIISIV
jgi:hypothetical protein